VFEAKKMIFLYKNKIHPTSSTATRHVCLGGALARPCTISVEQVQ